MCAKFFRFVLAILFISVFTNVRAGIIETSKDVCLGNVAYFKVKGANGISSVNWTFGDGFTSKSPAPFHLYKTSGKYTVKLDIQQSNGSQLSDSIQIEVHELPKAALKRVMADSCLYTNRFIYSDESIPSNPSNPIVKSLIVWGDGSFNINNNRQYGNWLGHNYLKKDRYKIKMEVTDDKGCKGSVITNVELVDGTFADIDYELTHPKCGEAKVCFKSKSLSSNGANQTYIWTFDGGAPQSLADNANTCISTSKSRYAFATLQLSNPDNTCLTKDSVKVYLDADILDNSFTQNGHDFCYGSGTPISIRPNTKIFDDIEWRMDGKKMDFIYNPLSGSPKFLKAMPGTHTISCRLSKGPCQDSFTTTFNVKGPVARMRIFNQFQCDIDKRVFFIDTSLNLNKQSALYYWTVADSYGQNCEIFRAVNQNKYKNCNRSRDWFGKHDYTVPNALNPIYLTVVDQSVGCLDSTMAYMEHFHCKLCNRGGGPVEICQGDSFLHLNKNEQGPVSFSLDTGKSWMKFPSQVNKPYKGIYGVLFAFKSTAPDWAEDYGDDSIQVHRSSQSWMDTVFAPDFLNVKETMDTGFWVEVSGNCHPFTVDLHLRHPKIKAGDKVQIDWKDGTMTLLDFDKDSMVNSVRHVYRMPGMDTFINLYYTSAQGCLRYQSYHLKFGKIVRLLRNGHPCINTEICFEARIVKPSNYKGLKKQIWYSELDSVNGKVTKQYCIKFRQHGYKNIRVVTEDSMGCIDTFYDQVPIRELKAGIVSDSRISYCSELKQMFDSSYVVFHVPGDYIESYYWDFGTGKYTSTEQNPFRSFDLSDSIIRTYHTIKDNNGCWDSIQFDIKIVGSWPKFVMTDTLGCAPLRVKFKNLSNRCSSYIWEFDDPSNSTIEDIIKRDQDFIYDRAGKFYPKLIGIDTFYNPYTGAVYYCHETFDPKRAVTVFDTKFARLSSPDTICLGESIQFQCESNVSNVFWNFGDGNQYITSYQTSKTYIYKKPGNYKLEYRPVYTYTNGVKYCKDSTIKQITVLAVKADFEIKSESRAPIFKFKNLSSPNYANLLWDFGDPGSSSSSSTVQNPDHNYKLNTGLHTICLTASVFNKCQDSVCKPINNNYYQDLKLYNVFTPGVTDSLNDEYDITIVGEASYSLVIYDRWGVVVFKGNSDAEIGEGLNWNGTLNNSGTDCPSGTYYYVFNYSFLIDPDTHYTANGTVTLIR